MNPTEWTELLKELAQVKAWMAGIIGVAFLFWLVTVVLKAWWTFRERRYQEEREALKETARIAREDDREHRLGTRIEQMSDKQDKAYTDVIIPATKAMTQFVETVKKCPGWQE